MSKKPARLEWLFDNMRDDFAGALVDVHSSNTQDRSTVHRKAEDALEGDS